MSSEFVNVTVAVPADRVADFYKTFGRWLEGAGTSPVRGWRAGRPWASGDLLDAIELYGGVSTNAKKLLAVWAEADGSWVDAEKSATAVGVEGPKGVAGSLSSVGKACDRMGRALPFEHEAGEGGAASRYRMTPIQAALFRSAAGEVGR